MTEIISVSPSDNINYLIIDGSILEGGGQIIRNTISYSVITNQAIKIINIRKNRDKPGLRQQHLDCIKIAKNICNAECSGLELNSIELTFNPQNMNQDFDYKFEKNTRGSSSLIIQCIIPILLFTNNNIKNIDLLGGTNVSFSPPIDYIKYVLFNTVFSRYEIDIIIKRRGYILGETGLVTLEKKSEKVFIKPINLIQKDDIDDLPICHIFGYCENIHINNMINEINKNIDCIIETAEVNQINITNKKEKQIIGFFIINNTRSDCFFSGSSIHYIKKNEEKNKSSLNKAVKFGIEQYKKCAYNQEICVDEYLQDQLIIFMALDNNTSKIKTGKITLHTATAIYFAELMTKKKFTIENIDEKSNLITCI